MPNVSSRFLAVYSGVLTVAFAVTVFAGFSGKSKPQHFDEISVGRINVIEPDGKLRLVISNRAQFPGSYVKGKEIERPDRQDTGLLFLDDEGTEMGGLTWGGSKDKNGKITADGHLSFDQYMQDQIFAIDAGREGESKWSAMTFSDRGDYSIMEGFEAAKRIRALPESERKAAWAKFRQEHPGDQNRVVIGRAPDNSSVLRLKDPQGRDRIVLKVDAKGDPVVQVLDAEGKVISQLPQK